MAIASGGTLGTGAHSSSANFFTFNTATNTLAAGNQGLLVIATDNISTADGQTNDHTSITGATGIWTKLGEYTNAPTAAAAVGVTVSVWRFIATGTVNTGTTITMNLSGNATDKACSFWKFTVGANMLLALAAAIQTQEVTGTTGYGSSAFSGLSNTARLYFRGVGKEANTTTQISLSANFTSLITNIRSRNNTNAIFVSGEFRLNTSTGETSNPGHGVTGDTASVFVALEEVSNVQSVTGVHLASTAVLYAPSLAYAIALPSIQSTAVVDSLDTRYQTTTSYVWDSASTWEVAQEFHASDGIAAIELLGTKSSAGTDGTVNIEIREGTYNGTILATASVAASAFPEGLSPDAKFIRFLLNAPFTPNPATSYWIRMGRSGGSTGNVVLYYSSPVNSYPGHVEWYLDGVADESYDDAMFFRALKESVFSPTISQAGGGTQAVTGSFISSTLTLTPPTVAYGVVGSFLASTAVLYSPTLAHVVETSPIASTEVLYPPTVTFADQNVTTTFLDSTATLFAPTVVQNLVGASIASTAQLFAPTLVPVVEAGTIASTLTLFAPTVIQNVEAGTITPTSALFAPSVAHVVEAPFLASTLSLFPPTLEQSILAPTIAPTTTLFAPTVTPGPVTVEAGTIPSTAQLFAPTLAAVIEMPFLASTAVLHAPALAQTVVGTTIVSTVALYPPTLAYAVAVGTIGPSTSLFAPEVQAELPSAQDIEGGTIASTSTLFAPTLTQNVTTVAIASTLTLYPPTLAAQIELPRIEPTTALTPPSLALHVVGSTIAPTTTLYAPTVEVGPPVVLVPFIAPTTTLHAPTISVGDVSIIAPFISSTVVLYPPSRAELVTTAFISSTVTLFPPAVEVGAVGITTAFIAPTTQLFPPRIFLVSLPTFAAILLVGEETVAVGQHPEEAVCTGTGLRRNEAQGLARAGEMAAGGAQIVASQGGGRVQSATVAVGARRIEVD